MEKSISAIGADIINVIDVSTETIWLYRQQYFYRGSGMLKKLTGELQSILQSIVDIVGADYLNEMGVAELLDAQERADEILIADVIEGQLLPSLEQLVQELQQNISLDSYDFYSDNTQILANRGFETLVDELEHARERRTCSYVPEYTATGHMTIRIKEKDEEYYVSGNNNPYRDALSFVQGNIEHDKYKYVILGAGMFFEAQALLRQRPDAEIVVVEEDAFLLKLALQYRNLSDLLLDDRVSIECCEYDKYFYTNDLNDTCVMIRKPSLRHIENSDCRMSLERFFVKEMTIKEQAYVLEKEFRKNIAAGTEVRSIDDCAKTFKGKTVYLVAGGPSLNNAIDILKNRQSDSIVLCVGTSVRRLKNEGIIPDYVIITDVADAMCCQLEGNIDYKKTSLLYMISANAKAVSAFKGKKYAIFQKGFDLAEDYACERGFKLVDTGGSVSTTALDVCITLECDKVVCIGLDLAYTANKTHAEGTLGVNEIAKSKNLPMVKSVSGGMIPTSLNLSCYHKWIENRIADEHEIEFINMSNGAYIKGMTNVML